MKKFICFFIILFFNGIINLLATKYEIFYLKLWKEFFITIIFISEIYNLMLKKEIKEKIKIFILMSLIVVLIYNSIVNNTNYLYQIKLDFIIFYIIGLNLFIKKVSKIELEYFYNKIIKIFFVLGALNSIIGFLETKFPVKFLEIVNLEFGNWGSSVGIKIITASGRIRAPGLLTTFNALGTIVLIGAIMSWEYKKKYYFLIFIFGIYAANYKTSYLGIIVFLILKFLNTLKGIKKNIIPNIFVILSLIVGFILMNFYKFYDIFRIFGEKVAYNSIYLRIFYHNKVINEFNMKNYILGQGLGKNGSYGKYLTGIPLDSTYIYLLGNYGIIFLFIFIIILLKIQNKLFSDGSKDTFMKYYIVIFLTVTFYQNVEISNFPANIIIITLIIIQYTITKNKNQLKME